MHCVGCNIKMSRQRMASGKPPPGAARLVWQQNCAICYAKHVRRKQKIMDEQEKQRQLSQSVKPEPRILVIERELGAPTVVIRQRKDHSKDVALTLKEAAYVRDHLDIVLDRHGLASDGVFEAYRRKLLEEHDGESDPADPEVPAATSEAVENSHQEG